MKKSVVILIAVIYVSSIIVVTFFGLKHNTFFNDIKVAQVEITNDDVKYTRDGQKYVVLPPGENTYQIEYSVSPSDAVNKEVKFIIEEESKSKVTVDENGLVTFNESVTIFSVVVYVRSTDGNGAYDQIEITKLR